MRATVAIVHSMQTARMMSLLADRARTADRVSASNSGQIALSRGVRKAYTCVTDMHDGHHPSTPHHGHGWSPAGPRRRWLEPFVLVLLARGIGHGYALVARLNALGAAPNEVDASALYRTLRDLEMAGLVQSHWTSPDSGASRREYILTDAGWVSLADWVAVMHERARLVGAFLAEYEALGQEALTRARADTEA